MSLNALKILIGGVAVVSTAVTLNKVLKKQELINSDENILNYIFVFSNIDRDSELESKLTGLPNYLGEELTLKFKENLGITFSNTNNNYIYKENVYTKPLNNGKKDLVITVNVYSEYVKVSSDEIIEKSLTNIIKPLVKKYCKENNIDFNFNFNIQVDVQEPNNDLDF